MHDTRKPIPTKIRPSTQKISIIRCAAAPPKNRINPPQPRFHYKHLRVIALIDKEIDVGSNKDVEMLFCYNPQ